MVGAAVGAAAAAVAAARGRSLPLPVLKPYLLLKHRQHSSSSVSSLPRTTQTIAMAAKPLEEADVGISCYVSSLPGFRGVLKQRYCDFIVHEVDRDGNIVRLNSFDLPVEDLEANEEKVADPAAVSYAQELESFRSLAGEADARMLEEFLARTREGAGGDQSVIVLSPDEDKMHRADVHNFFKKNFKFLITDTVEESDHSKRIRVRFCSAVGGRGGRDGRKRKGRFENDRPFDSRGSDSWPKDQGKFLRFHLFKENKDTQEALGVVAKMLGIQPRSFGFAGTKDKRAVTTQKVTVFKQHAKRLVALNKRLIGIRMGNFSYEKEGLLLGQLLGNHFTITLRGVIAESQDVVRAAAEGLGRNGFINYYGLQRFGSGSIPTHLIGAALLRGEWQVAANLILDPRDGERDEIRQAREYYKVNGDIDGTLRRLPRYLIAEKAVLQCLKKCPGNYLQALRAIPRTLRMMYVHSYQSYLWNHAASTRVQKYGINQVVLGDLVFCKDCSTKSNKVACTEPEDDLLDTNDSDVIEISDSAVHEEDSPTVNVVDAYDILEGRYSFEDIVLPLPGSRIIYPENDIAEVYSRLAGKDGINLTETVHGAKEFSITGMTGGYRRVFQKPKDFSWEIIDYTDPIIPLAETDMDFVVKARPSNLDKLCCTDERICDPKEILEEGNAIKSSLNLQNGKVGSVCSSDSQLPQTALKLGFTLPASSYATMAIRELLKNSTSVASQKSLNH